MFHRPRHKKVNPNRIINIARGVATVIVVFGLAITACGNAVEQDTEHLSPDEEHSEFLALSFIKEQEEIEEIRAIRAEAANQASRSRQWNEAQAKAEADRIAKEEAEEQARLEAERKKREEEERIAAEKEAERKAQEEAERKEEERKAEEAKRAARQWVAPIQSDYRISATFGQTGQYWSSSHSGLDFAAPEGTRVYSVSSGDVTFAGWDGAYGYKIVVRHWDGTETWYAHLSSFVREGGSVEPGTEIGRVGSTGNSTGPHLHLEVRPNGGSPIDPRAFLAERGVSL